MFSTLSALQSSLRPHVVGTISAATSLVMRVRLGEGERFAQGRRDLTWRGWARTLEPLPSPGPWLDSENEVVTPVDEYAEIFALP